MKSETQQIAWKVHQSRASSLLKTFQPPLCARKSYSNLSDLENHAPGTERIREGDEKIVGGVKNAKGEEH